MSSFTQVGIVLDGVVIAGMVVGGPAYNCGLLDIGDRILTVNGLAVDERNIDEALLDKDIPGRFFSFSFVMTDTCPEADQWLSKGLSWSCPSQNTGREAFAPSPPLSRLQYPWK